MFDFTKTREKSGRRGARLNNPEDLNVRDAGPIFRSTDPSAAYILRRRTWGAVLSAKQTIGRKANQRERQTLGSAAGLPQEIQEGKKGTKCEKGEGTLGGKGGHFLWPGIGGATRREHVDPNPQPCPTPRWGPRYGQRNWEGNPKTFEKKWSPQS